MKRIYTILICSVFIICPLASQELDCSVSVTSSQMQGSNKRVFEALKKSLEELFNNTRWTNMSFKDYERIGCSFGVVVNKYEDGIMYCDLQIQCRRPVWGTGYYSPLLNLRDPSANFAYSEFDRLTLTQSYENNLVAIVAYYAYTIIGYYLDSFRKLGGSEAFNIANNIVAVSQSRSAPENEGWRVLDKNGLRYNLSSNMTDERFVKFREFMYVYHRLGLDVMSSNVANGRAKIASGISDLSDINRMQPGSAAIVSFTGCKKDEIVNIFAKHGSSDEINKVYETMVSLDPVGVAVYDRMKQSN